MDKVRVKCVVRIAAHARHLPPAQPIPSLQEVYLARAFLYFTVYFICFRALEPQIVHQAGVACLLARAAFYALSGYILSKRVLEKYDFSRYV